MAEETGKFTHIGLTWESKRKIAILAAVQQADIYKLAEYLIDEDWKRALKAGMVTDAMLEQKAHWVKAVAS